jgi:hypothetical protein
VYDTRYRVQADGKGGIRGEDPVLPSVREEGEGAFEGIEGASPPRREPFHVLEKAEDIAGGFAPRGLRGNPLGMTAGEEDQHRHPIEKDIVRAVLPVLGFEIDARLNSSIVSSSRNREV